MSLFNKLTIFSILILLLTAFVSLPVMAETGGATVGIKEYTGKVNSGGDPAAADPDNTAIVDYEATRDAFIVTVTFSKPVALGSSEGELDADKFSINRSAGENEVATSVTGGPDPVLFPGSTDQKKYTLKINLGDTDYESSRLVVSLPADAVNDLTENRKGNQASTGGVFTSLPKNGALDDWTITFTLNTTADAAFDADDELLDPDENPGDGNLADGATFTVLVTAKHASATVVPDIPADQIYVGGMQLDAASDDKHSINWIN